MRILIAAGDVSGDIAGGLLTREILAQAPQTVVIGFGGPSMAAAGADVRYRTSHLGVAGVTEIGAMLPGLARAIPAIARIVRQERPAAAVLIGNDLFSVFLGRFLRRQGVLVVSYFPPPTWMWGPAVRFFAHSFDAVLASFPDENQVYRNASVRLHVEFVGHYLADRLRLRTPDTIRAARARLALSAALGNADAPVVALMPGSRSHEVMQLLPVLARVVPQMLQYDARLQFVLPVADPRHRTLVERELQAAPGAGSHVAVIDGPNYDAIEAADVVILASGTASLEATLLGVPMVIVYKVSALTAIMARLAIRIGMIDKEVIGLPNLILNRMAVPELTQEHVNAAEIAAAAWELLASPARRDAMTADLREAASLITREAALAHAAAAVLRLARNGATA